ncbi:MAG: transposase [Myxococcota bacterium]
MVRSYTWSQTLQLHPHVHCIVPNGGLDKEGNWRYPSKSGADGEGRFLFPVAAMKKLYRGYFMAQLKVKIEGGEFNLPPDFPKDRAYKKWKDILYHKDWVVYTKKPFSGVKKVVDYLARYSHRVALTNHRIKNITEEEVTFEYKDYKDGAKKKLMTLKGEELLRRFCLHILPKGLRKVRKYGMVSNASKKTDIPKARKALDFRLEIAISNRKERKAKALERLFGKDTHRCPCCKKGEMKTVSILPPERAPPIKAATAHP